MRHTRMLECASGAGDLAVRGYAVTPAVAAAVGYRTPSAFAAMFREHLGASPSQYFR